MEAEVAEKRHRKRDTENGFSVYTVVVTEKQAFMKKGGFHYEKDRKKTDGRRYCGIIPHSDRHRLRILDRYPECDNKSNHR